MSSELLSALAGVAERLVALAKTDDGLRAQLQTLARAVLAATEPPAGLSDVSAAYAGEPAGENISRSGREDAGGADDNTPDAAPVIIGVARSAGAAGTTQTPRIGTIDSGDGESRTDAVRGATLTLGAAIGAATGKPAGSPAPPLPAGDLTPALPAAERQEISDADLPLIEKRLRLKGEGTRWAATRRRRTTAGADFWIEIEPLDREIIEKAKKLPDCFLWMNHPTGPSPGDLSLLDDLAGCFDTAAAAVALIRGVLNESAADRGSLEQAMRLLAEAQSALRAAVAQVGYGQDKDQLQLYIWLRGTAWKLQYFVERYMKIEDAAEPSSWTDIDRRIEELDGQLQLARQRGKQFQSSLKRIRYHLKPIMESQEGDRLHDWKVIVETVEKMVQDGAPPSNTELRELLLPAIDHLPDTESPPGFGRVLREIDRFSATRLGKETPTSVEPTLAVRTVADLLRGKSVVLIGGMRRSDAHGALKTAFGLKDLDWIETREHESTSTFEPHVARPDVALVILAIRWSSHSYGDVKAYCDRYEKPLVRLPAGYNPNQVAMQVLAQCSEQLSGR